jgi:hypothetical protein
MDLSTFWLVACFLLFIVYRGLSKRHSALIANPVYRVAYIPIIALPSLILDRVVTGTLANYVLVGVLFVYMVTMATKSLSNKSNK